MQTSRNLSLPLTALGSHQRGTVVELYGGRGLVSRLAALGFTPGAEVIMVRNDGRGPVIVSVLDTQIALGRGQANKITVRCQDGGV